MGYSNPFAAMANTYDRMVNAARPQQNMNMNQRIPIDEQQFRQFAITLNDNSLNRFAQQARAQGISEQDIQDGIKFIKSL